MPGLKEANNKRIVRNYVAMPDRMQFSAMDVAAATGVNLQTVRNVLNVLHKGGVIIKTDKRISGRVYYRNRVGDDGGYVSPAARAKAQDMRDNGDEYHQILSEVM